MQIPAASALPLVLVLMAGGCAVAPPGEKRASAARDVVVVPATPARDLRPRVGVAHGLANPRGMLPERDGSLLVAVAGTGEEGTPGSGALLRLAAPDAGGRFRERRVVFGGQPSKNILHIVRRDEVFGVADVRRGGDDVLASVAFFGGPSSLLRVTGARVSEWGGVNGNLNSIAWDPERRQWFAVSSSSEEIVRLRPGGGGERIVKLPPLADGQDAVPGYLRHDPTTRALLVTLFSGSVRGEEGGTGTELVRGAGGVVRVDPDTGAVSWVVRGLTTPTDLEVDARTIYVLEFTDAFLDPVRTRRDLFAHPSHGGFRRFAGRLLAIDRAGGGVRVLAEGLDGPTNLARDGDRLYVAEGMGTPGRPIPGPGGVVKLEGFIERVSLADG